MCEGRFVVLNRLRYLELIVVAAVMVVVYMWEGLMVYCCGYYKERQCRRVGRLA